MENLQILTEMVKHHKKIERKLRIIETTMRKGNNLKRLLADFRKTLEQHFDIEENTIFTIYKARSKISRNNIPKLLDQHHHIRVMTNLIERELRKGRIVELLNLKKLLVSHQKFEENDFYLQLDKQLNLDEKKKIITQLQMSGA